MFTHARSARMRPLCDLMLQTKRGVCVCLSVGHNLVSAEMDDPIDMPFGLWAHVGPRKPRLGSPSGEGAFLGTHYRDSLQSAAEKRLTRLTCGLGRSLVWANRTT